MVARRRISPRIPLIALASLVTAVALAIPATAANAASPTPSPSTTTHAASAASAIPKPPQLAPGLSGGPARPLRSSTPTKLPPGVKALGPVQPGQIFGKPGHNSGKQVTRQISASPNITEEGPYNIQPYTYYQYAADAYHQNNPTYAWLYYYNDTAAQQWWLSGEYDIGGYYGYAIFAQYDGTDMCMNVKGNVYAKGTQIWVSGCATSLQLNELWQISAYTIDGTTTMYTLCASYDTGLCINVKGGIAPENDLIIWDLDQLWDNSLWQFYNA